MPSLDDILNSGTLLRMGNGSKPTGVGVAQPMPAADPAKDSHDENKEIWHFKQDFLTNSAQLDHISELTCKVNSMSFMEMTVCDSIDWGPVDIDVRGNTVNLPLTTQFMVLSEYLDGGIVPAASTGFWQLEANLDKSFQNVFCYDLGPPATSGTPQTVDQKIYESGNFMPEPVSSHLPVDAEVGTICTIALSNLYVVVVVSLVTCMERNDFEPGGVLGAGRLYPLIQVMANQKLDKIVGKVRIKRPASLPPGHQKMNGEEMTKDIGAIFFADLNNTSGIPITWRETFSHYWTDPTPGAFVMTDPAKGRRSITGAVVGNRVFTDVPPMKIQDRTYVDLIDFEKLEGQGEFDNLHLAPKMNAPASTRASFPNDTTLVNIAMAPFCIHDCLHTHTRWGNGSFAQPRHIWGWDGFTPYARIGAPLLPPNQKVTINLVNSHEFVYQAEVIPNAKFAIDGGQWQIIYHHGSAYALSIGLAGILAKNGLGALLAAGGEQIISGHGSWAMFYWKLRYARGVSTILERVEVLDMAKARS
ncbi:MAG: hypothetical protein ABI389_00505 [Rhodanobacter sp.]